MVGSQLGRPARGQWAVADRCHLGLPTVIESHPVLDDGSPFPTLYWLTCPLLVRRASRLESQGAMADINRRIQTDGSLRARVAAAAERYRACRNRHAVIQDDGAPPGGGPDRIKCLHAHLAHELAAGEDPVGAVTLAATGWPDCVTPCVAMQ